MVDNYNSCINMIYKQKDPFKNEKMSIYILSVLCSHCRHKIKPVVYCVYTVEEMCLSHVVKLVR